ncbi:MAG: hypothetical protein AcusKO_37040 [Acuticoccus sp.]
MMDVLSSLADGFTVAFTVQNLFLAALGCFLGTVMGALPGLGPSNGVAILIPLAFTLGLPPTAALILLTSVYYGAMYGGRISSILLNIPGDEPALMTCLDGYPMAQKGRAGEALALSGRRSFVGASPNFATWGLPHPLHHRVPSSSRWRCYFGLRAGRVFRALHPRLRDARWHLLHQPGQGRLRRRPRPPHRDDRRRRADRRAAFHLRRGTPL